MGEWIQRIREVNSLALGRYGNNFKSIVFKPIIQKNGFGTHREIALKWMPQNLIIEKSTVVQIMAWCRQVASHYLNQCWPKSMLPYDVTRPHWVNMSKENLNPCRRNRKRYLHYLPFLITSMAQVVEIPACARQWCIIYLYFEQDFTKVCA